MLITKLLLTSVLITVSFLGITYQTARRYINQLEEIGILREITGQARNRVYRADEVLAAIEEPLNPNDDVLPGEAR